MIFSFSKYADVISNLSLIREAADDIYKESSSCLRLKGIQIVAESIKMNKARASLEMFCAGLEFGSL